MIVTTALSVGICAFVPDPYPYDDGQAYLSYPPYSYGQIVAPPAAWGEAVTGMVTATTEGNGVDSQRL